MQGSSVFESEGVAGVQDWLGLSIGCPVEEEDIRDEGGYRDGCGGVG